MYRSVIGGFLVAIAALVGPNAADATATLALSTDGGATFTTITDGGAGDGSALPGVVVFNGSLGSFIVSVSTGITKPSLGSGLEPQLDLNSVNVTGTAPGTLIIKFSETGFTGEQSISGFNSHIGGTTAGSSLTFATYADGGNGLFGQGTSLGSGSYVGPAFSDSFFAAGVPGAPYSLTEIVSLSLGAGQSASFDANLAATPEPVSLLLFGTGLVGLGFLTKKKGSKV